MLNLNNKIALVTGSSSGIGKATVELFTELGATVIGADINEKDGKKLEEEINNKFNNIKFIHRTVDV
ncbi:MAG: SDR family NAD(P)-dependent oxidoreductase, partial [Sulfolobus sp.]|nr:SDR family NAD(P)-dependent oxidoreductase [Sulfolobus sp.]